MPKKLYFAHKSCYIDKPVTIGKGTEIWHFSHIYKGAIIGKDCKIGQNVVVHPTVKIGNNVKIQNNVSLYDGVILEDYVFCGPSCVFTNVINPRSAIPRNTEKHIKRTLVHKGASIGANATIRCGVEIGAHAFIGAGAVLTKNVGKYELWFGAPAKRQGWICECGNQIRFTRAKATCSECKTKYIKSTKEVKKDTAS